jgi:hypothetical protein
VQHASADGVRAAQQVPGAAQVGRRQRRAYCRTRDPLLALDNRGHLLQFERALRCMPLQQTDIARAARTKAKVVADQQPARLAATNHELDEGLGGQ